MKDNLDKHEEIKKQLLSRLKRIEGQARGIHKMIEEGRPCGDIVIQLGAIKAAVNRVGFTMLGCHLASLIEESVSDEEKSIESSLEQFMSTLGKFS